MRLQRRKGSALYNPEKDELDFEGHKYNGDFLRSFNIHFFKRQKLSMLWEQLVDMNGDVVWSLLKLLPVCKFNGPLQKLTSNILEEVRKD